MKQITVDKIDEVVNKYLCFTLQGEKAIGKVIKVDKEKGLIIYKVYGGKMNGETYQSEYATYMTTKLDVYEEEEAVVAVLAH
jgi:hypothetical protein